MNNVIEQLVKEVRRLAAESPDNVYQDFIGRYEIGKCSNGTIGCIFGQAGRNLNIDWIKDNLNDSMRIGGLIEKQNLGVDRKIIDWCNEVQCSQDEYSAWGICIERGDDRYPGVYDEGTCNVG